MKQSKRMSFLESAINIAVGFGISLGAQMVFLPMLGVPINHAQNFIFACIMTVISLCRSFLLRRIFEALHIRTPLSPGMLAVIAERRRQIEVEGWDAGHDAGHNEGDLARAGAAYLLSFAGLGYLASQVWPFEERWFKPDTIRPRRDLVRGLSLGLADLEKLDATKRSRAAKIAAWPPASAEISRDPSVIGDGAWNAKRGV